MKNIYSLLNDYERTSLDYDSFTSRVYQNEIIVLKGTASPVLVGHGLGLRINSSVGLNSSKEYSNEIEKIQAIAEHSNRPDIMMDLSTTKITTPLYQEISKIIGCPVGTIPYYTCFDSEHGIDENKLLEIIEEQAENGVSFMTLHQSANMELAQNALCRNVPIISRGGSLLLRDMRINNRAENVLIRNIDRILPILKKHRVAISIGTTYRPSTQYDALDSVHKKELKLQKEISKVLRENGLQILMEGIGHISFNRIPEFCAQLRENGYIPFMPLGPIVSDRTPGQDHITSSIGAAYLASLGGADIINAVTREEHTGGIPSKDSILEAIDAASTVVKIVNDSRFASFFCRKEAKTFNCTGSSFEVGCARCGNECPFIWNMTNQNL